MGLFSFPFQKPIVIEDSFFGRLVQERCDFSDSRCCWYAESVFFAPIGNAVECMIDAEGNTPSLAQRAFFQEFERKYPAILLQITHVVESDSRLLPQLANFASTHRLAGLTIPKLAIEPTRWEVWFEQLDTTHWGYTVTVCMVDDLPQVGIGISA